jgi:AAA15 family ATPase/GTPase
MYDEDNKDYKYKYGNFLKGQKKTWERSTKKNALFLSTAINLQDNENNQLSPIYNWFLKRLTSVNISGFSNELSKEYCMDENKNKKIISFLQLAGIDIQDIKVDIEKRNKLFEEIGDDDEDNDLGLHLKQLETLMEKVLSDDDLEKIKKNIKINFIHSNGISLKLEEQSDGTKKLFSFASHWLESLEKGKVIFIDELNDNFHPALVKLLVDMFNDKDYNNNGAQLIFTTHETSILNQEVLRRDQIWFCDRNENLSTKLYPLSDFKPRKDYENIENSYLSGRYGALPYFQKISYKMNSIGN